MAEGWEQGDRLEGPMVGAALLCSAVDQVDPDGDQLLDIRGVRNVVLLDQPGETAELRLLLILYNLEVGGDYQITIQLQANDKAASERRVIIPLSPLDIRFHLETPLTLSGLQVGTYYLVIYGNTRPLTVIPFRVGLRQSTQPEK